MKNIRHRLYAEQLIRLNKMNKVQITIYYDVSKASERPINNIIYPIRSMISTELRRYDNL